MHLDDYQGQHHNTAWQVSGAESGIVGRSPPIIIAYMKFIKFSISKMVSPVAITYLIMSKEYMSNFFVNLRVWKTSGGAIKGKNNECSTILKCCANRNVSPRFLSTDQGKEEYVTDF